MLQDKSVAERGGSGWGAGLPRGAFPAKVWLPVVLGLWLGGCADSSEGTDTVDEGENIIVTIVPAAKPTELLPRDVGCVTAECHAAYASAPRIHAPLQEGVCSTCHEADTGAHVFAVKAGGNARCLECHDTGQMGTYRHSPLDDPGCLGCHDPHVSTTVGLLRAESVEAECATCHEKILKRVNHEPFDAGECTSCHDPHAADNRLLLVGGVEAAHCFTCHEDLQETLASREFDHAGVAYECSACHSAHATDFPGLLLGAPAELCSSCHAEKMAVMAESAVGHDAVLKGGRCAQCHAPHGSDRPGLLRAGEQAAVCLQCHATAVTTADGRVIQALAAEVLKAEFRHGPVQFGDCASCHTVHGGSERALLVKNYAAKFYAAFDVTNFALCFECHTSELVTLKKTESATEFRDGMINLHYLHINREERGSSCRTCHSVHGSDQPRHIARAVVYEGSDWLMPIRFELTPTGGRCAPGCHEPMSYSRSHGAVELNTPRAGTEPGGGS